MKKIPRIKKETKKKTTVKNHKKDGQSIASLSKTWTKGKISSLGNR